jgi:phage shock protein PspC (stress-responsive transcriptional regulator)
MQTTQPPLWARDHTLFGVCEALGEDLGFNPLFLRIPLAALLLWNPIAVVGTYVALGALVLLTRWLAPNPSAAAAAAAAEQPAPATAAYSDRDMALAA